MSGAIPTWHAGVKFRSRLEARYAAWFDACGVDWLYEPFDLDGYIPDFIIGKTALVEVKPALGVEELHAAADKVWASGWMDGKDSFAMVVGVTPGTSLATFRRANGKTARVVHNHSMWVLPYADDITHEFAGAEFWSAVGPNGEAPRLGWSSPTLDSKWLDAGNTVQWHPVYRETNR